MRHTTQPKRSALGRSLLIMGLALSMQTPLAAAADVGGQAKAVQAKVLWADAALADTGTLNGADDAREAAMQTASILSVGQANTLHAATISNAGDGADSVASEASLSGLALEVAGTAVSASFVMAQATAPLGGSPTGRATVEALSLNGASVHVTGQPNQTVDFAGGRLVINEQVPSAGGMSVNALRLVVTGVADIAIASVRAAIAPDDATPAPLSPGGATF